MTDDAIGRPDPDSLEVDPRAEVPRVEERDGYFAVVKRPPCEDGCPDCPHGPYLYHVTTEPHPDGSLRHHWTFIGRVEE